MGTFRFMVLFVIAVVILCWLLSWASVGPRWRQLVLFLTFFLFVTGLAAVIVLP